MPRVHHGDAIAHAEDLRQLGRDHDDRHAALGKLLHQLVDFRLRSDVDALRRLVENQERRLRRQPARQRHLLLIAARQRSDLARRPTPS